MKHLGVNGKDNPEWQWWQPMTRFFDKSNTSWYGLSQNKVYINDFAIVIDIILASWPTSSSRLSSIDALLKYPALSTLLPIKNDKKSTYTTHHTMQVHQHHWQISVTL